MAALGVVLGGAGGLVIARVIARYAQAVQLPGLVPIIGSALVLLAAAAIASLLPAVRASRVDVIQALRTE